MGCRRCANRVLPDSGSTRYFLFKILTDSLYVLIIKPMPSRNIYKVFAEGAYYHVYNRGVEKRVIFSDEHDYKVFIHNLRRYLEPGFKVVREDPKTKKPILATPNSSFDKISLLAFCLMPNHYHLIVKLKKKEGLTDLMKKVCTNYTGYFNSKYDRVGKLYQGIYKAVPIKSREQFIQVTRYIHLNPLGIVKFSKLQDYPFSSFYYISRNAKKSWLNWEEVLGDMSLEKYRNFMESFAESDDDNKYDSINDLLLE